MPMTSTRCFRISGSRSCALAGRVIGAMTSGFAAFARETSVERSEGGSDQGMTSTISHDGLAALWAAMNPFDWFWPKRSFVYMSTRSEEHTSELQSLAYLVCRLLLEKKKNICISVA